MGEIGENRKIEKGVSRINIGGGGILPLFFFFLFPGISPTKPFLGDLRGFNWLYGQFHQPTREKASRGLKNGFNGVLAFSLYHVEANRHYPPLLARAAPQPKNGIGKNIDEKPISL